VNVDVLAVGAHPDDVELGVGGLLRKLTRRGVRVAILDLTRGEMSSRGTVEERAKEAARGAEILGVSQRENAGLPDGAVANINDQQLRVIPYIRRFRPRILLATMENDRHPDHSAAHALVRDAAYFSGLSKIETDAAPYRPPTIYYYHPYYEDKNPPMIVDISDYFDVKIEALRAHASQFYNPAYIGAPTHISTESFWESIRTRAAYWGMRVGAAYGEPLYSLGPVGLDIPPGLEKTL
jgi:bacillithiol biosynthesis deacetylase BshB1